MGPSPSHSEKETFVFAERLGRSLPGGSVVALVGEIGSGKTIFAKGLAKGLGVRKESEVKSPTFVLLHSYQGRMPVYHFDLYRLERPEELEAIGFDEFVSDPSAVSIIEWADRSPNRIPKNAYWIHLKIGGPNTRKISVRKIKNKS